MSQLLGSIQNIGNTVAMKGQSLIDSIFPPEKRAELLAKIKSFALKNPKLSAFLLTNFVLTGPPLVLFGLFTLTVFVFALVVGLIVALLAAVGFTLFAVITALLILFPTVFFTTLTASFLFLWGLGGYYLLKWFNKGEQPAIEGGALGDKLNSLTGGRLDFLMNNARGQEARGEVAGGDHKKQKKDGQMDGQTDGQANGHAKEGGTPRSGGQGVADMQKNVDVGNATDKAKTTGASVGSAPKKLNKNLDLNGVQNKAGNAQGTLKGTAGGATGLA